MYLQKTKLKELYREWNLPNNKTMPRLDTVQLLADVKTHSDLVGDTAGIRPTLKAIKEQHPGNFVTRDDVATALKAISEDKSNARLARGITHPKVYVSNGAGETTTCDGIDKLRDFGLDVHIGTPCKVQRHACLCRTRVFI